jgi:type VI protein secretion system component Hcp
MKKILLFAAIITCITVNAQVGVGTTTPNASSVLDLTSTNKGVLIPRIGDTTGVPTPPEGLIIYNKNTKSPYYYNGTRWMAFGALPNSTSVQTDRITYKITGGSFTATEEEMFAFSTGASKAVSGSGGGYNIGNTNWQDFSFTKELDINTVKFNEAIATGTILADIEFKFYAQGSANPYISYKYRNIVFTSYSVGGAAGGGSVTENLSFIYNRYGFKDYVNTKEFGWDIANNIPTAY